jgi:hypothetical protein
MHVVLTVAKGCNAEEAAATELPRLELVHLEAAEFNLMVTISA